MSDLTDSDPQPTDSISNDEEKNSERRSRLRSDLREMVVVVLSILIAFSLDAWWDRSTEEREARVALTNLRAEFAATRPELVQRIQEHRRAGGAALGLVARVEANGEAASVEVPDSMVSALFVTPTFDPSTGSLEGLLASGSLVLIDDLELRQELAGWLGLVGDASEDEVHILELTRRELIEAVGQHARITRAVEYAVRWSRGEEVPESYRTGMVTLPVSPRLANVAYLRSTYARWAADELDRVLLRLDRILTLLDAELD